MKRALLALALAACGTSTVAAAPTATPRYRDDISLPPGTTTTTVGRTTTSRVSRGYTRPTSTITVAPPVQRAAAPAQDPTGTDIGGAQESAAVRPQIGTALTVAKVSWYGEGNRTASGARFDPAALTFASRTLPFGSRVTFRYHGRAVTAVCNDRGPFVAGLEYDLSRAAFQALAPLSVGVIVVETENA